MTLNNKILPVALVAALLGGSVGAFVMRPSRTADAPAAATTTTTRNLAPAPATSEQTATARTDEVALDDAKLNETGLSGDAREAYRQGFNDGVDACRDQALQGTNTRTVTRSNLAPERVVYRSAPRTRSVRSSSPRRVYYDYSEPRRSRSFWQKHRDKLTVAMGAGGGAILGGLIGGKKGAAIGALAGGGGSALYTYKLRKRDRRY